jgi:7-cyano-7-deazaguanine synthase
MNIVCELSGGADSVLAACKAKDKYPGAKFYGIFIDYGQISSRDEEQKSKSASDALEFCGWKKVTINGLFDKGLTNDSGDKMSVEDSGLSSVYTPLRNFVIGSMAASYAESVDAEMIIVGSKSLEKDHKDPYSYNDSIRPFYTRLEEVVNFASEADLYIEINPILAKHRKSKMTKLDVFAELLNYGFDMDDTISCFYPIDGNGCGECNNCIEKQKIFAKLEKDGLH